MNHPSNNSNIAGIKKLSNNIEKIFVIPIRIDANERKMNLRKCMLAIKRIVHFIIHL